MKIIRKVEKIPAINEKSSKVIRWILFYFEFLYFFRFSAISAAF